jgi:hypothetical protein
LAKTADIFSKRNVQMVSSVDKHDMDCKGGMPWRASLTLSLISADADGERYGCDLIHRHDILASFLKIMWQREVAAVVLALQIYYTTPARRCQQVFINHRLSALGRKCERVRRVSFFMDAT